MSLLFQQAFQSHELFVQNSGAFGIYLTDIVDQGMSLTAKNISKPWIFEKNQKNQVTFQVNIKNISETFCAVRVLENSAQGNQKKI